MIETTQLGSTGIQVTRIGLGMAALGRPGYINLGHETDLYGQTGPEAMERHAQSMLNDAYELGVRYFDTARSYGDGEGFLGRWLTNSAIPESAVAISSKWGYRYVADWQIDVEVHEVKEHTVDNLNNQIDETNQRLGDYLDVYQIHSATIESGVLDNDPVLDRLAELKDQGVAIGLSTSGPDQARAITKALSVERDGDRLFATIQATWNLLETSAGPALAAAHTDGMGVVIKESVANGRLTSRDPLSSAPILDVLPQHSPDSVAIAAVLAQPFVDAVISGAATVDHLRSHLDAFAIDPDRLSALPDLAENPDSYWETRSNLSWT